MSLVNISSVFLMSVMVLEIEKTLFILTFNYILYNTKTKIGTVTRLLTRVDSLLFQLLYIDYTDFHFKCHTWNKTYLYKTHDSGFS